MKKILTVLIFYLLTPSQLYSQDLYPKILSDSTIIITSIQLKNANKLFLEGKMYKELYTESLNKISNYKLIVDNYKKVDSLRVNDIEKLNKNLALANKKASINTKILGCSSIILAILSIILFIK